MKFYSLILTAIAALGLTSCLGSSTGTVLSQDFSPYIITLATDVQTNESLTNTSANYKVSTNTDKGICSMTLTNLKLSDGSYVNIEIPDQRYAFSEAGALVVKLPSFTSVYNGVSHTITDYNFEYYSRYLNNQAYPLIVSSFVVDNRNEVRIIYSPAYYWGTTVVTDSEGKVFTNKEQTAFYGVQFDADKKTANCIAWNMKFAENMPALNMLFKDLPYTLNQYSYTVSKDEIIPYIGDTPYPDYKITDFTMTGTWGGNQLLKFKCTIDTEKVKGTYDVVATLSILPKIETGSK